MSKVITFSRTYPSYHPRAGESTYFVEKFWKSFHDLEKGLPESFHHYVDSCSQLIQPGSFNQYADFFKTLETKHHTIRAGHRWKEGDWFSPRVWSGKPYNSKMIQFAPDIQIKKVWNITVNHDGLFVINGDLYAYPNSDFALQPLAENDGLTVADLLAWFNKPFSGQIICWNENINY